MNSINKNVLMAVYNDFNPDNRVFRAADAIQSMGYSVELLAYHKDELPENEILGTGFNLTRLKLKEFIRIHPQFNNWQKRLRFKKKAKKYANIIRPEIVHCHDYNTLFLGIYCKKRFNSKVIYDCHEYFQDLRYLHRYPLIIRKNIARFERDAIKRFIDEMIVVSPGIADLYQKFSVKKIHVIRNIPDFSQIDQNSIMPDELESYLKEQLKKRRKLLIYLGTNTQKGRGMNFAFNLLKELPDNYGMVTIGAKSREEIDFLMKKSFEIGITDRFKSFLALSSGQLFHVAKYCYMGLSLIEPIYTSYKHSLPNKLFEYFSMDLPVLSSDIPDQSEIILKYNAGLVIPFNVERAKELILQSEGKCFDREISSIFTWESEKLNFTPLYNSVR